ncbi:MAG: winged helix-turn-helix domain-containing protein [Candidatus Omnitrophica bacterium]|nr:winged helix-turn-helix domain-containing protein [Candidatus Omnitrophota bacterium]
MITEIGIVAGEIWHYLDGHNETLFSAVVKGIERPKDLGLMSLGWLAREGHVLVRQDGRDLRVALRNSSP